MAGSMELSQFTRNSPAARAVLAVLRQHWSGARHALTMPGLCWLLKHRNPPIPASTVQHAILELYRLGAVVSTGGCVRTHTGRLARTWRPA